MEMKDIIKSRRLELGLTQLELAELCHADRTTVGKWESGDIINIKRDKLQLLAKALNVSHLVLLGAEEYIPSDVNEILIYDAIYTDKLGNQIASIKNPYPEQDGQFFGLQIPHPTFKDSHCFAIFNKKTKVKNEDIVVVSLKECEAIIRKIYIVDKDIVTLRPIMEEGELITLYGNDIKEMNVIGKYCFTISPFVD